MGVAGPMHCTAGQQRPATILRAELRKQTPIEDRPPCSNPGTQGGSDPARILIDRTVEGRERRTESPSSTGRRLTRQSTHQRASRFPEPARTGRSNPTWTAAGELTWDDDGWRHTSCSGDQVPVLSSSPRMVIQRW